MSYWVLSAVYLLFLSHTSVFTPIIISLMLLFEYLPLIYSDDLPQYDPKYAGVDPADLPRAESLKVSGGRGGGRQFDVR